MEQKDYVAPTNKRKASIFFAIMILLSIGLLIIATISFHSSLVPDDLIQISCNFHTYEIHNHTRSISYDLMLISEDYDMPFQLSFLTGIKSNIFQRTSVPEIRILCGYYLLSQVT